MVSHSNLFVLIESSSKLLVPRTYIKFGRGSSSGRIRLQTLGVTCSVITRITHSKLCICILADTRICVSRSDFICSTTGMGEKVLEQIELHYGFHGIRKPLLTYGETMSLPFSVVLISVVQLAGNEDMHNSLTSSSFGQIGPTAG